MSAPTLRIPAGKKYWRLASAPRPFPNCSMRSVKSAMGMTMVCISLLAAESKAAITFSNPIRTLLSTNNKGSSHAVAAPGNAPFNETARVDWSEYWASANTTGQYYSTASQDSTISASGITAKGSVKGTGSFEFWGSQALSQSSRSSFAIDFTLNSATTMYLTGVLDIYGDVSGSNTDFPELRLALAGPSGTLYSQNLTVYGTLDGRRRTQINQAFASLAAGQYNLTVYAETVGNYYRGGIGGDGNASYNLTLIPEPTLHLIAGLGGLLVLMRRARCTG